MISALAAMLEPERFQYHAEAAATGGIFSDDTRATTRVVDGACIFLNRPGLRRRRRLRPAPGRARRRRVADRVEAVGVLAAAGRVDWEPLADGRERPRCGAGPRADWGDEGETMAWCCTEGDRAYVGDRPVIESLAEELEDIVGSEVYVELRRRLA